MSFIVLIIALNEYVILLMLYELKSIITIFYTVLKKKLSPTAAKASSLLKLDPADVYSHLGY